MPKTVRMFKVIRDSWSTKKRARQSFPEFSVATCSSNTLSRLEPNYESCMSTTLDTTLFSEPRKQLRPRFTSLEGAQLETMEDSLGDRDGEQDPVEYFA